MKLRVSGFQKESIVDGPGLRYVIFTQGCPHRCPGCHNPETHDPAGGRLADTGEILADILENPLLSGVTFSGGEPLLQVPPLLELAEGIAAQGLNLAIYTGYTLEQLAAREDPRLNRLLSLTYLLVDGPYRAEERDLELPFRGSRNQRIIRCADSLKAGEILLLGQAVTV